MLELKAVCDPAWIDFNGHMRDAYYLLVISWANDQIMDELGMGPRYLRDRGATLYNIDTRIRYLKEAHEGEGLTVRMRLLDADEKRLHLLSVIHGAGDAPLAVNETVVIHVDQRGGPRAAPFPGDVAAAVKARLARDAGPEPRLRAGAIGLRRLP